MMAKKYRKMLAIALATTMLAGTVDMSAYAEEAVPTENPVVEEETRVNDDSTTTDITTTTTTSTDENGNSVVTVEIQEVTTGTTDTGVVVDKTETTTTTTTESATEITTETVTDGSETKEYTEDVQPGQEVPAVEIPLTGSESELGTELNPGETATGSDSFTSEPVKEGDLPEGEDDPEYDFTTTTTERGVEAELTENKDEVKIDTNLECPVGPEEYEGKQYYDGSADDCKEGGWCGNVPVKNPGDDSQHYREGLLPNRNTDDLENWGYVDPKPEDDGLKSGYDFVWSGYGDGTAGAAAVYVENVVYLTDENGEIVYENGFPVVDMEESTFVTGRNGKSLEGLVGSAGQFALKADNGEYFYAYCMDADTGASPNTNRWYQIRNLEDAIKSEDNPDGYITEEEAAMIRAIATVGYWGTDANVYETEADGSLKLDDTGNPIVQRDKEGNIVTDSSVRGSVASLKELLRTSYSETDVINLRYPGSNDIVDSNPETIMKDGWNIYELIDGLTEAEALAATQAAIWTFANNGDIDYNGKDLNASVIGVLSATSTHSGQYVSSFLNEFRPAKDCESDVRMQALYYALLSLNPIYPDDADDDTNVIPNENVFENIVLVVEDKVEDHAANQDDNSDNDVYNTALNFTLAFVPDPTNDDLLLYLTDAEGNVINDKDGKPIVRRLAGTNTEGRTADTIVAENGVYTLTGLQLGENADFVFDLRIEGTQYLNEGVYIYQAHGGRKESQTLVGLATGNLDVDVAVGMTLNFNVDDKNHVIAESKWHEESSSSESKNESGSEEGGEYEIVTLEDDLEAPNPTVEISVEAVPLADAPLFELFDEEIPLADVPLTGDNSTMWFVLSMLSVMLLFGLGLSDRKKKA